MKKLLSMFIMTFAIASMMMAQQFRGEAMRTASPQELNVQMRAISSDDVQSLNVLQRVQHANLYCESMEANLCERTKLLERLEQCERTALRLERQGLRELQAQPRIPFRAPRTPVTVPFSHGFEGTTGTAFLDGWIQETGAGAATGEGFGISRVWHSSASRDIGVLFAPHTGTRMAIVGPPNEGGLPSNTWLFSPEIVLAEGVAYRISFYARLFGNNNLDANAPSLKLHIGENSGTIADMLEHGQEILRVENSDLGWTLFSVDYTPTSSGNFNLGFHAFTPAGRVAVLTLDDISVTEVDGNDLEVRPILALTQIPTTQLVPLSATIANIGFNAQTNIVLSATRNGASVGASAPHASLPAGETVVLEITPAISPVLGTNTIVYTVTQAETDVNPDNNTATVTFVGTENMFATDILTAPTATGFGFGAPGGTMAVIFEVTQTTFLDAIQVLFSTQAGTLQYTLRVFPMTGTMTASTTPLATRTQARVPGAVTIDFSESNVILTPGRYAVAITAAANFNISHDGRGAIGLPFYSLNLETGAVTANIDDRFGPIALRMIIDNDPPIRVASKVPVAYAENVATDSDIVITFNRDVTLDNYAGITFEPANVTITSAQVTSGNVLTIVHDGLDPAVMYRITLPADLVQGDFAGATWTFTTAFPIPDFPDPFDVTAAVTADRATLSWDHGAEPAFTEGFEGLTGTALPTGWTPAGGAATTWRGTGTVGAVAPHTGTRQLASSWSWGGPGWVFSQGFELTEGTTYEISFWWQAPGIVDYNEPDNFRVRIGTGQTAGTMTHTILEQETTAPTAVFTWTQLTHQFTPTATGTFYLGFERIHPNMSGNRLLFDDIVIAPVGTVEDAESFNIFLDGNLVASDITTMSYQLTGLAVGDHIAGVQAVGPGPDYDVSNIVPVLFTIAPPAIAARTPGLNAVNVAIDAPVTVTFNHETIAAADLTGITFDPAVTGISATIEDGNVLTITHDGFQYGTNHTVTIPAGTIAYVTQTITWSFRTVPNCDVPAVMAYDFEQDFNLTVFPPDCWIAYRENTAIAATWQRNTMTPRPGSVAHARHPNGGVANQTSWLITNAIEVPNTGVYQLTFWDRFQWGEDGGTFQVWISTETDDIADFDSLYTSPIRGTGSALQPWMQHSISLEEFAGETVYIAFRVQGSGVVGGTDIFTTVWDIDDISIDLLPVDYITKYPVEDYDNVRVYADIVVTFNQAITAGPNFGDISIAPTVTGFTPSVSGAVLTIAHNNFEHETLYTVTIPAGAITGLAEAITWSFTTTVDAIIVLDRTPAVDAVGVPFMTDIVLTFNQDIQLVDASGIAFDPPVTGVQASVFGDVLTITHDGFAWETLYAITIPVGTVTNLNDRPMDDPITWTFTSELTPLSIPYFQDFANADGPRGLPVRWTVTEGEGGWQGGGGAGVVEPTNRALFMNFNQRQQGSNAWAFSESIWLEEGVPHVISFYYMAPGHFELFWGIFPIWEDDDFRVKIGREATVEAMVAGTLVYELIEEEVTTWRHARFVYTPSATGIHHLGFQNLTPAAGEFGERTTIDAISIMEAVDNDIVISAVQGQDVLTQVPISQPLPLNAVVTNRGTQAQTDIVLSATRNGTAVGTSAPLATLAVDASAVLHLQELMTPVLGTNVIVYTVTQAETDEVPGNNTMQREVTGTADMFAFDTLTGPTVAGFGHGSPGTLANVFEITQATTLSAVQILFSTAETTPALIVSVFEVISDNMVNTTPVATTPINRSPGVVNVDFSGYSVVLPPGRFAVAVTETVAGDPGNMGISRSMHPGAALYVINTATGLLDRDIRFGGLGIRLVIDDRDITFELASKTPEDGATNVALDADVAVTFNLLVEAGDLSDITINPPVAGTMPRVYRNQLIIDHDGFAEGTLYTVTIPVGAIVDWDEVVTWSFTTAFPAPDFPDPFDLAVAVDGQNATLTWDHTTYVPATARITLVAGNVWGDGSGYQMWLNNTGLTVDEMTAGLPANCNIPPNIEGRFAYRIPTNATLQCNSAGIVVNNSVTIDIPAGVYSFIITSPEAGSRIWLANQTAPSVGTAEDFTFEAGMHYTFTVTLVGQNDFVTLTYAPIASTAVAQNNTEDVENFNIFLGGILVATTAATDMEYVFTNLAPGDYIAGVQAVSETGLESNIIPVLFTIEPPLYPGQVALTAPANNAQNVSVTPTLTWTAPTSGGAVVEYFVYLGETATNLVRVAELPGTETSFTVAPALPINATRYWRVIASNATGEGEPSAMWSFTTGDPTNIVGTLDATAVQLFPNPVTDGFFYVEAEEMRQIEIIDMLGRTVMQKNVNSSRERVDVSNLRDALYFVRVTTTTGTTLVRIVVQ